MFFSSMTKCLTLVGAIIKVNNISHKKRGYREVRRTEAYS
jgi:hypothetical protein